MWVVMSDSLMVEDLGGVPEVDASDVDCLASFDDLEVAEVEIVAEILEDDNE